MESKLQLTPSLLVTMVDEECQVLKHSGQWVETIDPSIAAMQAMVTSNKEGSTKFFQALAANLKELSKKQREINKENKYIREERSKDYRDNVNNPDWLFTPPTDLNEVRTYKGRQWSFCTKCGRNGRWVCTHSDDTHRSIPPRDYNDERNYRRGTRDYSYDHDTRYRDHYGPRHQDYRDRDYRNQDSRSRSPLRSRSHSPHARHE
jgi:hypothetical protein